MYTKILMSGVFKNIGIPLLVKNKKNCLSKKNYLY